MKNRLYIMPFICIMILAPATWACDTCGCQDLKVQEGFTALFNGKNLDGWYGHATKDPQTLWDMTPEELKAHKAETRKDILQHWTVENGELVNDGHGLYATTDKDYGDFELLVEYKTVPLADSGIYLRGCPQVQIWDTTEAGGKHGIGADKGSGGLWNNYDKDSPGKDPSKLMDKPFGQWNAFRIIMVGSRVTVWLNGERIVDHAVMNNFFDRKNRKLPIYPKGPIQLQTHGGEIRWRNVFIREINAVEANRILRRGGPERRRRAKGFSKIFNGTWDGWAGPTEKNEINRKQLLSKSGTVYTDKTYDDFVVRFDFKLPPGGNNGLAIRYPGNGDTAYVGMCELQVLDNTATKYAKLRPQQYHGSVYGMVAAQRGYLREAGQWNYQEVRVQGMTIKVELNGTVIVDADLSKVDPATFMSPKFKVHPHTSGHFGFAGHGDPVVYKNIDIKEL